MNSTTYCYACDLKDDEKLIADYKKYHKAVWPEIIKSIKDSGILKMQIYHCYNRLFMITEVSESFDLERKQKMDKENPIIQEWEQLMWKYQQALPKANPDEKWILMDCIFKI
ncbi:L-rhamnose mutarotase [Leeuwenhoekiella palythoae]|uniref:L-rhamnose mutarotase n=1 Tax=Leeuwenhoekiella palythoae TaxID=573501 RepID=A0A1M5ZRM6_9FLAO|nr:L-rhamnose mutarotase [Leeuwenhoekiella palythoae]RXG26828.1 L-rhamnose mutarotase [Leeuwenhoekiella palythoae]SHI26851.1 L-rhamnose mutarotase [Leeuwenhoekiella palythoae]